LELSRVIPNNSFGTGMPNNGLNGNHYGSGGVNGAAGIVGGHK
jgi:hypothetical protein